jgi:PrtD family type I secretion system ABC transporter
VAPKPHSEELAAVLRSCRRYFTNAGFFSLGINLLYLAAPLYMLQVYDRVLSSASRATLVMLTIGLFIALMALAGLDVVRARILSRAGVRLDAMLAGRVVAATVDNAAKGGSVGSQSLRDFDKFRQFLSGGGVNAFFDMPWAPIYVVVIFLLHPLLGAFALVSVMLLIAAAVLNERFTRAPLAEAGEAANKNYRFTELSLRNWEVVRAMGMLPGLLKRWGRDRNRMIACQAMAADRMSATSSLTRFLRLSMQSLILGLGAYLVIERDLTVGAMFAGVILLARALQPAEQIIGQWRNLNSARTAFERVRGLLATNPLPDAKTSLPRPRGRIAVEAMTYGIRGSPKPILTKISFSIEPGEVVAVIGPSGAGKSTLARLMVGALAPIAGAVRIDGADVSKWPLESLGQYIGYLPQDIELFADTVAANIRRFRDDDDAAIIRAARMAGVHELILGLSNGYDTQIGEGGVVLSGGLRQRIALARAVYGSPSLVVLDEPNSNLDAEGDAALVECIGQLKARGTTVVIIAHRSSALGVSDKIVVVGSGTLMAFGPRNEVLPKLARPAAVKSIPTPSAIAGGAA